MPRRRNIKIVSLIAVVLASGFIAYVTVGRWTPEPSSGSRSASYWLRAVFGANGQQRRALEAFRQMGTNAYPVLVAAIAARESSLARIYRRNYPRLPAPIRPHLPKPDDPAELRSAALYIVLNNLSIQLAPEVLPLLKEPDSELRWAVLVSLGTRLKPTDAGKSPLLLLAVYDPDPKVRSAVLQCLSRFGSAATNAMPAVLKLCGDSDMSVRTEAARTLWKITGQTNTAVPVLEGALDVFGQRHDAVSRHWVACNLLGMGISPQTLIPIFINSLTNSHLGTSERVSACGCLAEIGLPAAAATPALQNALQDPDPEVRRRARAALIRIEPSRAATNSP